MAQAVKMLNMHTACGTTIACQAITSLAAMRWTCMMLGNASVWL